MAIGTAMAVIGTAVSAYGAYSSAKGAKKSRNAQERMHDQQIALAREQMDFSRDHYDWARGEYDDYRAHFDPILDELTEEAMREQLPDYGQISADVGMAFDSARDSEQRALARYGIRPGDGRFGANEREYGIAAAGAEVSARQQARRQSADQRYQRLAQLYGVGSSLQGQAMSGMNTGLSAMSGASANQQNAAGSAANMHGRRASSQQRSATNNMIGLGRNVGSLIDTFMNETPSGGLSQPGNYGVPMMPGHGGVQPYQPPDAEVPWMTPGGGP